MKRMLRSRKAVSPVIATIIIVAIAIVMSIAVAYWVLGLGASFTKYEKVAFVSAYATGGTPVPANYTISMTIKNQGTAAATLDPSTVFYNGRPSSAYASDGPVCSFAKLTLDPGQSTTGTITMISGTNFVSGMSLEVMIQTASGSQYPKVIVLP